MSIANTTISLKKSSVPGKVPTYLANGELAINTSDGKLYYSDPQGIVKSISQYAFSTVNVGGSILLATSSSDTINFVAGNNITLSSNTLSKTITVSSNSSISVSDILVSNTSALFSGSYTTSSTSQVAIDSFLYSKYRSAKYEIQITSGTNYHLIELRLVHDGTNIWLSQYGEIVTSISLGTFDAILSGQNLQLLFTPTFTTTTINYYRTALLS